VAQQAIDPRESLIAELLAENAALRRRLPRDEDTGLFGRAHFDERLSYEWQRALATWTGLSLIYIDASAMDRGDNCTSPVMRRLGLLLEDACREIDVACRVGANAIAIILPDTNRTGAEAECGRLRDLLEDDLLEDEELGMAVTVAFDEAQSPLELMLIAGDAAHAERCHSVLPPRNEDLALDLEGYEDVLLPTPSELPLFESHELEPTSGERPVGGDHAEADEDTIPTIPAGRPSWMAA
jgi:diguanylate cyclase (GGDEF)-like protein